MSIDRRDKIMIFLPYTNSVCVSNNFRCNDEDWVVTLIGKGTCVPVFDKYPFMEHWLMQRSTSVQVGR